jgi:hypothetical protein
MRPELQRWTADDVPPGPYYHGTRTEYEVGAQLHVDEVNPADPDPERQDDRRMCFATTCFRSALQWAYQRRSRSGGGATLRVYEVDLPLPEVDTNAEGWWRRDAEVRSVMAPDGVITRLHLAIDEADYVEGAMLQQLHRCPAICNVGCRSGALRLEELVGLGNGTSRLPEPP